MSVGTQGILFGFVLMAGGAVGLWWGIENEVRWIGHFVLSGMAILFGLIAAASSQAARMEFKGQAPSDEQLEAFAKQTFGDGTHNELAENTGEVGLGLIAILALMVGVVCVPFAAFVLARDGMSEGPMRMLAIGIVGCAVGGFLLKRGSGRQG